MGHIFGQVITIGAVLVAAVVGIWKVIQVGERPYQPPDRAMRIPGRRAESYVLAALIGVVAVGVVAALLLTWPTT